MSQIAIDKEINLNQLREELSALTGETDIGFHMLWDGTVGSIEILRAPISVASLQAAVDAHVAGPPIPPVEPDPNQDILDDIAKLAVGGTKDILVKIVARL